MKKKQKLLVALMALTLAGGVGSALAASIATTYTPANNTDTVAFDQAIELNWGSGQNSVTINSVSDLQAGVAKYRALAVTPKSSKTVAGTVTLTFTIHVGTINSTAYTAKGFQLEIFQTSALAEIDMTQDASSKWINDTTYSVSGTPESLRTVEGGESDSSGTVSFSVTAGNGVHETARYYLLAFTYNGAQQADGKTFGGEIVISQSFAANA